MTLEEDIGKFSGKDLSDYIEQIGASALADKCIEVTNHIRQLTRMMGEVMREEAMVCIIGSIEVHVVCYGAGNKIFEAKLGKQATETKEGFHEQQ